jgi:hypothetical protein
MGKEITWERSFELRGVKREIGDGTGNQILIHLTMRSYDTSSNTKTLKILYLEFHCNISDLTDSYAGHEWTS